MAIKNIPVQHPIERSGPATLSGKTFKVRFLPLDVTVGSHEGQSLLEVCEDHRIPLDHACGGNCACSSCRVIIHRGMDHLSAQDDDELDQLDEAEGLTFNSRLGCQAKVYGDVDVEIPPSGQAPGR